MPFDRPTLSQLVTNAVTDMKTNITGASTLLRRSVLRVLAKVQAGANHGLYGALDYIARQIFVHTSDEAGLRKHGIEWGIDRDEANEALGNIVITGTTGLIATAGKEVQSADGQIYTIDTDAPLVLGTVTVAVTAQQAGAAGNQEVGSILIFVDPIDGIDANTTVDTDGLNEGEDIETLDSWADRILARKRNPPHGGAEHDYVNWMLEVDGVTRAWAFPLYNGVGTIGVAFVRDAESPIVPSASEIATVRAYIIQHTDPVTGKLVGMPVTAKPGLVDITLLEKPIDMTVAISPNTTAIQAEVTGIINDVWVDKGGPGETVELSKLQTAIGRTANLEKFRIDSPLTDITAAQTEVHTPGIYTFTNY